MSPDTPRQLYLRSHQWSSYLVRGLVVFLVLALLYSVLFLSGPRSGLGLAVWFGLVWDLAWFGLAAYTVYLLYRFVGAVERMTGDDRF
ncbi:hypothetical protein [Halomarina oriensis]|uniref:DUF485 domain-containing protein n=1 Tax=Halomarina oriensis TaxID=671145 RepID=A0A6B0GVK5_9EURY|nr:hypothetical protein [Halomarina oriensis]MWG36165.1 hypothetical protein [Halomarina oriensis]